MKAITPVATSYWRLLLSATIRPWHPRLSLAADCALRNPSAPIQSHQAGLSQEKNLLAAEQLDEALFNSFPVGGKSQTESRRSEQAARACPLNLRADRPHVCSSDGSAMDRRDHYGTARLASNLEWSPERDASACRHGRARRRCLGRAACCDGDFDSRSARDTHGDRIKSGYVLCPAHSFKRRAH